MWPVKSVHRGLPFTWATSTSVQLLVSAHTSMLAMALYQYGMGAWRTSAMRRELLTGNYRPACDGLLDYRKLTSARQEGPGWNVSRRDAQGKPSRWEFDCSTPGNKVCRGVWTRQLERHQKCMGMQ